VWSAGGSEQQVVTGSDGRQRTAGEALKDNTAGRRGPSEKENKRYIKAAISPQPSEAKG
jgi:hypothetical protein